MMVVLVTSKKTKIVWIFPSDNVNRCPVRLVDKYVLLCPQVTGKSKKHNFYLRSLEKINPAQWYGVQPVGKNSLSKVVANLLKSCNPDGYFTNHSLRRTSATRLFQASLELSVTEMSRRNEGINCNCNRQKFEVGQGQQLAKIINELLSKRKSGNAKIKLEIEFSD